MIRTSQTDPLEICETAYENGIIGVTFCPGKSGPSIFGAPWRRDLGVDLAAVGRWKPDYVLTLIEEHEFDLLQVRGLGDAVRAAGMTWIHAPIEDLGVPSDTFERQWVVVGHLLRHCLCNGGRVLVHCRGGLGRAGLVAARLMVELGQEPDAAIAAVRDARPGAIETLGQEAHVRSVQPVLDHDHADRVLGCFFGGAVGDAFGYAVEFDSLQQIRRRHGAEGLTQPQLNAGRFIVSDDTQMTLFTAEAVNRTRLGNDFTNECRSAYLRWYGTQTRRRSDAELGLLAHAPLWYPRAPGNTCMSALDEGGKGTTKRRVNNSKGCGGVMRTAPIGLVRDWDERTAFERGGAAAAVTHGHPSGFFSAAAMSAIVRNLLDGAGLPDAVDRALRLLAKHWGARETRNALKQAVALAGQSQDGQDVAQGALGEGWVGEEALAIAVYSCLVGSGFEDTMRIAANHDGDSDSTASIAGQLFGAQWGLGRIPWSWVEPLDVLEAVCEVAQPLAFGDARNQSCA